MDHREMDRSTNSGSDASHGVYMAFLALLFVFIQEKHSGSSRTAFQTHRANMITSLLSLCFYFCFIMLRKKAMAKDSTCFVTIFNYALVFLGILIPVSLVFVVLPYKPLWLGFFICALFLIILTHYFYYEKIKAASSTSTGTSAPRGTEMANIPPSSTTPTGSYGA